MVIPTRVKPEVKHCKWDIYENSKTSACLASYNVICSVTVINEELLTVDATLLFQPNSKNIRKGNHSAYKNFVAETFTTMRSAHFVKYFSAICVATISAANCLA